MPQTLLPSVLGNVVANRQRLSAIRQRMGLESSDQMQQAGRMQAAAPMPPGRPAMSQTNPGAVAMTGNPTMAKATDPSLANPASGNMETGFKFDDATRAALLPKIQQFLDQHGPQQQALADQERKVAQAKAPQQQITDPSTVQALAPLATFLRQNGRMPTPQELEQIKQQRGQAPAGQQLPGAGVHKAAPPPAFKYGGQFMAPEPIRMVGNSGKVYGVAGEAGMKERISITPTNQPQGRVPQRPARFQDGGDMTVDPNFGQDQPDPSYDPSQDQPDPSYDPSQDPSYDPSQDSQPDYSPPQQQQAAPPPDMFSDVSNDNSNPEPTSGNPNRTSPDDPRVKQAVIDNAIQWANQNGADPTGEVASALDGLDGFMKGQQVAPEWEDSYGGLVSDLIGQSNGFKVSGGTGQSFGASSGYTKADQQRAQAQKAITGAQADLQDAVQSYDGKPASVKAIESAHAKVAAAQSKFDDLNQNLNQASQATAAGSKGPVHFGSGPQPLGTTQEGQQAPGAVKKQPIASVQDYVKAKGQLPSLDEAMQLGVVKALGGPGKATPEAIFKWRSTHLTGTDKDYFAKFGKLPSLKDSVEYEANTVLTKSLGRPPTALEKYNYLAAHSTEENASDLLQSGSVPSMDTLRRLEMANIVGSTEPPKGPKAKTPLDFDKLVTARALTLAQKSNPGDSNSWDDLEQRSLAQLNKLRNGQEVEPDFVKNFGDILNKGPWKIKVNKPKPPPEEETPPAGQQTESSSAAQNAASFAARFG